MNAPARLWVVFAALSLVVIVTLPNAAGLAQEGTEATVVALQTEVASLKTMVALQAEVASLSTQVASGTEVAFTTASPTPNPAPEPGTILYEADWSNGMTGWGTGRRTDWKGVSGMLVNDGTGGAQPLLAPYQPGSVADYAVETDIQFLGVNDVGCYGYSFGVIARAENQIGYVGGVTLSTPTNPNCGDLSAAAGIWSSADLAGYDFPDERLRNAIAGEIYDPGEDWHTYRLEVRGNNLRLFIDGSQVAEGVDNSYLAPGRVGLWSYTVELNVRNFKVIAL